MVITYDRIVKGPTWQYSSSDGYYLYLTYRRVVLSLFEAIWIQMDLCFLSHSILETCQRFSCFIAARMEMLSTCFLEVHAPRSLSRHAWSMEGLLCFKSSVFPMLDVFRSARNGASSWQNQCKTCPWDSFRLRCLINGYKSDLFLRKVVGLISEGLRRPRFKESHTWEENHRFVVLRPRRMFYF